MKINNKQRASKEQKEERLYIMKEKPEEMTESRQLQGSEELSFKLHF